MTQKEALDVLKTGANVFLTGEPGAGKTYVINEYVRYLRTRKIEPAITASTGIAATHIGGYTIHSWSGIGIKRELTEYDLDKISQSEWIARRVKKAGVLIIDEISMLRAETLDMVDAVCREVRRSEAPFGGLQVVLVGDFFQLPPVEKSGEAGFQSPPNGANNENKVLFQNGSGRFAYASRAWRQAKPLVCYLNEQHRQDDGDFLEILSAIRRREVGNKHTNLLNSRFTNPDTAPQEITKLFSHNADVDRVNLEKLETIQGNEVTFTMENEGAPTLVAGLKRGCLSPEELRLKKGAVVMCTKNNPKERFVNGTIGTVINFDDGLNFPVIKTREGREILIEPMDWSIEEGGRIKARISQVPLRLAWAITVHKSQGMSMGAAVVDLSQIFEYGQGYVALSRVLRLGGLYLLGLNDRALQVHPEIFEQDDCFRTISAETKKSFGAISSDELKKMHRNFVVALGGKWKEDKPQVHPHTKNFGVGEKNTSDKHPTNKGVLEKIRQKHKNAYARWTEAEDRALVEVFQEGKSIKELSHLHGRKPGGIHARLVKLGLIDEE